ncbi:hypothetical protein PQO01_13515 [Lentisphaera marina]|uniref:hypothetical protein n=1 Tax=Lentisphaera marina TaxID=1111041 RepID=UPI002365E987|nr:hypothetical protein [Lentisphaera marina]MDD7985963.1 hypothetical protein [Lentisphaera marina]
MAEVKETIEDPNQNVTVGAIDNANLTIKADSYVGDIETSDLNDIINVEAPNFSGSITTNGGRDEVNVSDEQFAGLISTGDGTDTVNLKGNNFSGQVNTGNGGDFVVVSGSVFTQDAEINTGAGEDFVQIKGNDFNGTVTTGEDDDSLLIDGARSYGFFDTGEGSDDVVVKGDFFSGVINTGSGDDNLDILTSSTSFFGKIETSDGDDDITIWGSNFSGDIDGGGGFDTVEVQGSLKGGVRINDVEKVDFNSDKIQNTFDNYQERAAEMSSGEGAGTVYTPEEAQLLLMNAQSDYSSQQELLLQIEEELSTAIAQNNQEEQLAKETEYNAQLIVVEESKLALSAAEDIYAVSTRGINGVDVLLSMNTGDVFGSKGDDVFRFVGEGGPESISLDYGDDLLILAGGLTDSVEIDGGWGVDSVHIVNGDVLGNIYLSNVEELILVDENGFSQTIDASNSAGVQIYTGSADDSITINGQDVIVNTGDGDDVITVSDDFDGAVYGGEGSDTIFVGDNFSGVIYAGAGDDQIVVGDNFSGTIIGGEGDNSLIQGENFTGTHQGFDGISVEVVDQSTVIDNEDDVNFVAGSFGDQSITFTSAFSGRVVDIETIILADDTINELKFFDEHLTSIQGGAGSEFLEFSYESLDYLHSISDLEGIGLAKNGEYSIVNDEALENIQGESGDESIVLTSAFIGQVNELEQITLGADTENEIQDINGDLSFISGTEDGEESLKLSSDFDGRIEFIETLYVSANTVVSIDNDEHLIAIHGSSGDETVILENEPNSNIYVTNIKNFQIADGAVTNRDDDLPDDTGDTGDTGGTGGTGGTGDTGDTGDEVDGNPDVTIGVGVDSFEGNDENNYIHLESEAHASVEMKGGDDIVTGDDNITSDIDMGGDDDRVILGNEFKGSVAGRDGNDIISVGDNATGTLEGGFGDDTYILGSNFNGTINDTEGSNTIIVEGELGSNAIINGQTGEDIDLADFENSVVANEIIVGAGQTLVTPEIINLVSKITAADDITQQETVVLTNADLVDDVNDARAQVTDLENLTLAAESDNEFVSSGLETLTLGENSTSDALVHTLSTVNMASGSDLSITDFNDTLVTINGSVGDEILDLTGSTEVTVDLGSGDDTVRVDNVIDNDLDNDGIKDADDQDRDGDGIDDDGLDKFGQPITFEGVIVPADSDSGSGADNLIPVTETSRQFSGVLRGGDGEDTLIVDDAGSQLNFDYTNFEVFGLFGTSEDGFRFDNLDSVVRIFGSEDGFETFILNDNYNGVLEAIDKVIFEGNERTYTIDQDEFLTEVEGIDGRFGLEDDLTLINNFGSDDVDTEGVDVWGEVSNVEFVSLLGDENFLIHDADVEYLAGTGSNELTLKYEYVGVIKDIATLNLETSGSLLRTWGGAISEINATSADDESIGLYDASALGDSGMSIRLTNLENLYIEGAFSIDNDEFLSNIDALSNGYEFGLSDVYDYADYDFFVGEASGVTLSNEYIGSASNMGSLHLAQGTSLNIVEVNNVTEISGNGGSGGASTFTGATLLTDHEAYQDDAIFSEINNLDVLAFSEVLLPKFVYDYSNNNAEAVINKEILDTDAYILALEGLGADLDEADPRYFDNVLYEETLEDMVQSVLDSNYGLFNAVDKPLHVNRDDFASDEEYFSALAVQYGDGTTGLTVEEYWDAVAIDPALSVDYNTVLDSTSTDYIDYDLYLDDMEDEITNAGGTLPGYDDYIDRDAYINVLQSEIIGKFGVATDNLYLKSEFDFATQDDYIAELENDLLTYGTRHVFKHDGSLEFIHGDNHNDFVAIDYGDSEIAINEIDLMNNNFDAGYLENDRIVLKAGGLDPQSVIKNAEDIYLDIEGELDFAAFQHDFNTNPADLTYVGYNEWSVYDIDSADVNGIIKIDGGAGLELDVFEHGSDLDELVNLITGAYNVFNDGIDDFFYNEEHNVIFQVQDSGIGEGFTNKDDTDNYVFVADGNIVIDMNNPDQYNLDTDFISGDTDYTFYSFDDGLENDHVAKVIGTDNDDTFTIGEDGEGLNASLFDVEQINLGAGSSNILSLRNGDHDMGNDVFVDYQLSNGDAHLAETVRLHFNETGQNLNVDLGDGANVVTVGGGVKGFATIDTGEDSDTFTIAENANGFITVNAGDGNDTVSGPGDNKSFTGEINLGTGDDTFNGEAMDNSDVDIYGEGGADTITVDDGHLGEIDGGLDNDTITADDDHVGIIKGGGGDDSITVDDRNSGDIFAEVGADTISVGKNNMGAIDAGEGDDTIEIDALLNVDEFGFASGTELIVDAGVGNDTITIKEGAKNVSVELGTGNDSVAITGDFDGTIDGSAGNDTITVSGDLTATSEITLGEGADSFTAENLTGDISASTGADTINVVDTIDGDVDLGADNDSLTATTILGDVDAGSGDDTILIKGTYTGVVDGVLDTTDIDLGAGDNKLDIKGTSVGTIDAGGDVDTVTLTSHTGDIDLDNGANVLTADTITGSISLGKDADTVTVDDIFDSGADIDTISLGAGYNKLTVDSIDIDISAGDGADTINAETIDGAVSLGSGDNVLNADTVTGLINTGAGDDKITIDVQAADISTGGGTDIVSIDGTYTGSVDGGAAGKNEEGEELQDEITFKGNIDVGAAVTGFEKVTVTTDDVFSLEGSDIEELVGTKTVVQTATMENNFDGSVSNIENLALLGTVNTVEVDGNIADITTNGDPDKITLSGSSNSLEVNTLEGDDTIEAGLKFNGTIDGGDDFDTVVLTDNFESGSILNVEKVQLEAGVEDAQFAATSVQEIVGKEESEGEGEEAKELTESVIITAGNLNAELEDIEEITLASGSDNSLLIDNDLLKVNSASGDENLALSGTALDGLEINLGTGLDVLTVDINNANLNTKGVNTLNIADGNKVTITDEGVLASVSGTDTDYEELVISGNDDLSIDELESLTVANSATITDDVADADLEEINLAADIDVTVVNAGSLTNAVGHAGTSESLILEGNTDLTVSDIESLEIDTAAEINADENLQTLSLNDIAAGTTIVTNASALSTVVGGITNEVLEIEGNTADAEISISDLFELTIENSATLSDNGELNTLTIGQGSSVIVENGSNLQDVSGNSFGDESLTIQDHNANISVNELESLTLLGGNYGVTNTVTDNSVLSTLENLVLGRDAQITLSNAGAINTITGDSGVGTEAVILDTAVEEIDVSELEELTVVGDGSTILTITDEEGNSRLERVAINATVALASLTIDNTGDLMSIEGDLMGLDGHTVVLSGNNDQQIALTDIADITLDSETGSSNIIDNSVNILTNVTLADADESVTISDASALSLVTGAAGSEELTVNVADSGILNIDQIETVNIVGNSITQLVDASADLTTITGDADVQSLTVSNNAVLNISGVEELTVMNDGSLIDDGSLETLNFGADGLAIELSAASALTEVNASDGIEIDHLTVDSSLTNVAINHLERLTLSENSVNSITLQDDSGTLAGESALTDIDTTGAGDEVLTLNELGALVYNTLDIDLGDGEDTLNLQVDNYTGTISGAETITFTVQMQANVLSDATISGEIGGVLDLSTWTEDENNDYVDGTEHIFTRGDVTLTLLVDPNSTGNSYDPSDQTYTFSVGTSITMDGVITGMTVVQDQLVISDGQRISVEMFDGDDIITGGDGIADYVDGDADTDLDAGDGDGPEVGSDPLNFVPIVATGIDLGAGDDSLELGDDVTVTIAGGSGEDTITLGQNYDGALDAGDDDDLVTLGTGVLTGLINATTTLDGGGGDNDILISIDDVSDYVDIGVGVGIENFEGVVSGDAITIISTDADFSLTVPEGFDSIGSIEGTGPANGEVIFESGDVFSVAGATVDDLNHLVLAENSFNQFTSTNLKELTMGISSEAEVESIDLDTVTLANGANLTLVDTDTVGPNFITINSAIGDETLDITGFDGGDINLGEGDDSLRIDNAADGDEDNDGILDAVDPDFIGGLETSVAYTGDINGGAGIDTLIVDQYASIDSGLGYATGFAFNSYVGIERIGLFGEDLWNHDGDDTTITYLFQNDDSVIELFSDDNHQTIIFDDNFTGTLSGIEAVEYERILDSTYSLDADIDLVSVTGQTDGVNIGFEDDLTLINNFGSRDEITGDISFGNLTDIEILTLNGAENYISFDDQLEWIFGSGGSYLEFAQQYVGAIRDIGTVKLQDDSVLTTWGGGLELIEGSDAEDETVSLYNDPNLASVTDSIEISNFENLNIDGNYTITNDEFLTTIVGIMPDLRFDAEFTTGQYATKALDPLVALDSNLTLTNQFIGSISDITNLELAANTTNFVFNDNITSISGVGNGGDSAITKLSLFNEYEGRLSHFENINLGTGVTDDLGEVWSKKLDKFTHDDSAEQINGDEGVDFVYINYDAGMTTEVIDLRGQSQNTEDTYIGDGIDRVVDTFNNNYTDDVLVINAESISQTSQIRNVENLYIEGTNTITSLDPIQHDGGTDSGLVDADDVGGDGFVTTFADALTASLAGNVIMDGSDRAEVEALGLGVGTSPEYVFIAGGEGDRLDVTFTDRSLNIDHLDANLNDGFDDMIFDEETGLVMILQDSGIGETIDINGAYVFQADGWEVVDFAKEGAGGGTIRWDNDGVIINGGALDETVNLAGNIMNDGYDNDYVAKVFGTAAGAETMIFDNDLRGDVDQIEFNGSIWDVENLLLDNNTDNTISIRELNGGIVGGVMEIDVEGLGGNDPATEVLTLSTVENLAVTYNIDLSGGLIAALDEGDTLDVGDNALTSGTITLGGGDDIFTANGDGTDRTDDDINGLGIDINANEGDDTVFVGQGYTGIADGGENANDFDTIIIGDGGAPTIQNFENVQLLRDTALTNLTATGVEQIVGTAAGTESVSFATVADDMLIIDIETLILGANTSNSLTVDGATTSIQGGALGVATAESLELFGEISEDLVVDLGAGADTISITSGAFAGTIDNTETVIFQEGSSLTGTITNDVTSIILQDGVSLDAGNIAIDGANLTIDGAEGSSIDLSLWTEDAANDYNDAVIDTFTLGTSTISIDPATDFISYAGGTLTFAAITA